MKKALLLTALTSTWVAMAAISHTTIAADTPVAAATAAAVAEKHLPEFVFISPAIAEDSDEAVHTLIKHAVQIMAEHPREARKKYIEALSLVNKGQNIGEYDYLWTRYGLLKSSFEAGSAEFIPGTQADYMKLAQQTLDFLPTQATWHYTETGKFKRELYRTAGNALAWEQMEQAKSKQDLLTALETIEQAVEQIESPNHYYILDTKVHILIKLDKKEEAFRIAKKVLDEMPEFGDFQDINSNSDYQKWLTSAQ